MKTVIETHEFAKKAVKIFSKSELEVFISYISINPDAGDIIPATGGLRKVRWATRSKGKRGGARVIYYTVDTEGVVILVTAYAKSKITNIPGHKLKR